MDLLTTHQRQIADQVLREEGARRRHLVVVLSGVHAYGFPSPDSDVDLRAIHAEPTARLLGLSPPKPQVSRFEVIEEVEIDYASSEIRAVLAGLVAGNGNYFERILGGIQLEGSPELDELRALARGALSRRIRRHYSGFARGMLAEWEKSGFKSAKRLLYVFRTALTGAHALRTGTIETDVTRLLDQYGFAEARALVKAKAPSERAELEPAVAERWRTEIGRAFDVLADAAGSSGRHSRLQDAVYAVLDLHGVVAGFNMYIAGTPLKGRKDRGINQLYNRADVAFGSQAINRDLLIGAGLILGDHIQRECLAGLIEHAL
jgi:predicted nucleotidyltransferase